MKSLLDNNGVKRLVQNIKDWAESKFIYSDDYVYDAFEIETIRENGKLKAGQIYKINYRYDLDRMVFKQPYGKPPFKGIVEHLYLRAINGSTFDENAYFNQSAYPVKPIPIKFKYRYYDTNIQEKDKYDRFYFISGDAQYGFASIINSGNNILFKRLGGSYNAPDQLIINRTDIKHNNVINVDGTEITIYYSGLGTITWMKDENGNETNFNNYILKNSKQVVLGSNNIVKSNINFGTINGDNNTVEEGCKNIKINGDNNIIKQNSSPININGYNNVVGNNCTNIELMSDNNVIGNNCNTIKGAAYTKYSCGNNCFNIIKAPLLTFKDHSSIFKDKIGNEYNISTNIIDEVDNGNFLGTMYIIKYESGLLYCQAQFPIDAIVDNKLSIKYTYDFEFDNGEGSIYVEDQDYEFTIESIYTSFEGDCMTIVFNIPNFDKPDYDGEIYCDTCPLIKVYINIDNNKIELFKYEV